MLNEKGVNYLKKYEPIGCRDNFTVSLLKERNRRLLFRLLTLTLDTYK